MTASVTPTRMPPRIWGRAAGSSRWANTCQRRGAQASGQLEQPRVDRADPDHRRDGDREEHDQRADHDLGRSPVPNHSTSSGASARIGRGLRGDEVRRQQALRDGGSREQVADHDGQPGADDEAEDDLGERRAEMRLDRPVGPGRDEPLETTSGAGRMKTG